MSGLVRHRTSHSVPASGRPLCANGHTAIRRTLIILLALAALAIPAPASACSVAYYQVIWSQAGVYDSARGNALYEVKYYGQMVTVSYSNYAGQTFVYVAGNGTRYWMRSQALANRGCS